MLEETSHSLLYVQFWREFCLSNLEKKKNDFGSHHQNSLKENLLDSVRLHPLARLLIEMQPVHVFEELLNIFLFEPLHKHTSCILWGVFCSFAAVPS